MRNCDTGPHLLLLVVRTDTADVAVLSLDTPLSHIPLLPLITPKLAPKLESNGTAAQFAGWGQTSLSPAPPAASLASRLSVVDVKTCQAMENAFPWPHWFHQLVVTEPNLCAFDFGARALCACLCRDMGDCNVHACPRS